jgi:2-polyprenyl-3-methyl-5-hydroxy-6-metoxy-1,4-benzoquinol methylase
VCHRHREACNLQRCPACETEVEGQLVLATGSFRVYRCPACHLRFSDPMRAATAEWYEQSSVYGGLRLLSLPPAVYRLDWRFSTFLSLNPHKGGRLLDVGCGVGHFLRLARQRGYQISGIDHDREAVRIARDKFGLEDVRACSVDALITEGWDRSFDVVTLFDVLEHLSDPLGTLRRLRKLLRPGGYLVCSVPSAERWPARFHPLLDRPPHHLTLWTPEALGACLAASGLTVRTIDRSPLRGGDLLLAAGAPALAAVRRFPGVGMAAFAATYAGASLVATGLRLVHRASGGFTLAAIAQAPESAEAAATEKGGR